MKTNEEMMNKPSTGSVTPDVEISSQETCTPSTSPSDHTCEVLSFPGYEDTTDELEASGSAPVEFQGRRTLVTLLDHEFVEEAPPVRTHAADPIKDVSDIWRVQQYLVNKGRLRDNLLFTCGVNFGLRIGDLLKLKVGHLLQADGSYRPRIDLNEEKTNKHRVVYLNDAVMDAADLFFNDLQARRQVVDLNDYLFRSRSNNGRNINKPIDIRNVERMLKDVINKQCGLDIHASTHCLRKTFAYHVIMGAPDRARAVEFLQKIFGHSSASITLMYAGITDDEIQAAYQNLNLGFTQKDNKGFNWSQSSGLAFRKAQ